MDLDGIKAQKRRSDPFGRSWRAARGTSCSGEDRSGGSREAGISPLLAGSRVRASGATGAATPAVTGDSNRANRLRKLQCGHGFYGHKFYGRALQDSSLDRSSCIESSCLQDQETSAFAVAVAAISLATADAGNKNFTQIPICRLGDAGPAFHGKPGRLRTTVHAELARKGVTRMLLWQEYKARHADGCQYSAFCRDYDTWLGRQDAVMRFEHAPGDKLFVDYAGLTMSFAIQSPRPFRQ